MVSERAASALSEAPVRERTLTTLFGGAQSTRRIYPYQSIAQNAHALSVIGKKYQGLIIGSA